MMPISRKRFSISVDNIQIPHITSPTLPEDTDLKAPRHNSLLVYQITNWDELEIG